MKRTATKQEWLERQHLLDNLNYGLIPDDLIPVIWDNLGELEKVAESVEGSKRSLFEKYAEREDGQFKTRDEAEEDTIPTEQGHVVMKDLSAFEDAVQSVLDDEGVLEIRTISLRDALDTGIPASQLRRHFDWMIAE